MTLAVNPNGDQLLEFLPARPNSEEQIPINVTVVACHQGKMVFIFHQKRQAWELPAGGIEVGETPEAAARRELREETGQIANDLCFVGLAKFRPNAEDMVEFGAVYTCELEARQPFQPNDEVSQIRWWDLTSPFDGQVSAIHLKLAQMTRDIIASRS